MTIRDMKIGETRRIKGFSDDQLSLKLLEMGFVPGTSVEYRYKAPLGDPICIGLDGYELSLRKNEAGSVEVE